MLQYGGRGREEIFTVILLAVPFSVHTVKKNAEALVAATKEIELEVNADKNQVHDYVSRSERRTKSQYQDW